MSDELEQDLETADPHDPRALRAGDERSIARHDVEQKERYFAVLSGLVARLEDAEKPLKSGPAGDDGGGRALSLSRDERLTGSVAAEEAAGMGVVDSQRRSISRATRWGGSPRQRSL